MSSAPFAITASTSSSSSDESAVEHGGWPSTVSVLETPERRKWRVLKRRRKEAAFSRPFFTPPSSRATARVMSTKATATTEAAVECARGSLGESPPSAHNIIFNHSPCLKTPMPGALSNGSSLKDASAPHVHLSASPMRSFHLSSRRLGANRVLDLPPIGSSTHIGSSTSHSHSSSLLLDDSGFHEQEEHGVSNNSSSSLPPPSEENGADGSSRIETPSKGIRVDSSSSSSSPLKDNSLLLNLSDGFIPEQASGRLEASISHGIHPLLNRMFALQQEQEHIRDTPRPPPRQQQQPPPSSNPAPSTTATKRPRQRRGPTAARICQELISYFHTLSEARRRLTFGETEDQLQVTRAARELLEAHHRKLYEENRARPDRAFSLSAGAPKE